MSTIPGIDTIDQLRMRLPGALVGEATASCALDGDTVAMGVFLLLPWPPAVNNLYATVNGRRVLTKRGRNYKDRVAAIVLAKGRPSVKGHCKVDIIAHYPDRRRRDLDGILKIVLDSLTEAGVYEDDSRIVELRVRRGDRVEGGQVAVWVEPGEECDQ